MKKGNVLDQQLGCVKAWDWSPEMRDPSFAFETFDAEALMGRQVTSHMSRVLASKSDWKKLVALSTAFIFLWSMCITPVMAETIKLEGGSVEVNVQDNTTNWKVQGNPVWNVPEFNVAQGSIYNIAGLGTGSSLALLVNGGSASNIFGTMNLFNLDFILQNIAGINIGRSAMINLNSASLIASTLPLNLSATDFLARNYQFSGQGAFLSNAGHIIGTNANLVALVSNTIENTGTIEVPMGTVALAAGNTVQSVFQQTVSCRSASMRLRRISSALRTRSRIAVRSRPRAARLFLTPKPSTDFLKRRSTSPQEPMPRLW